jgi:ribokinase
MKVLNFGSLNIDNVYNVEHFVRPGETLQAQSLHVFCGGKGLNQSIALARAGVSVYHAGKIGHDGKALMDILHQSGVNTDHVIQTGGITGHTIIQVDRSGQNCILLMNGENGQIDCDFIDSVLSYFQKNDILLLQNEINNLPYIMHQAHKLGLQIALNPSPISKQIFECPLQFVKWFLLNEIEGNELTHCAEPDKIADHLLKNYPESSVVLTLGKKGAYYQDKRSTCTHGIYDVRRVDSTGAGDTFTGYFIAGVVNGFTIEENFRTASIASSLAVSKQGAASSIPSVEEVLNFKGDLI